MVFVNTLCKKGRNTLWERSHSNWSMRQLVRLHQPAGSKEQWMLMYSLPFSFYFTRALAHMLPIVRVGLPSSVKTFWKQRHWRTQSCVSMEILNSVKLTVKINYHKLWGQRCWRRKGELKESWFLSSLSLEGRYENLLRLTSRKQGKLADS